MRRRKLAEADKTGWGICRFRGFPWLAILVAAGWLLATEAVGQEVLWSEDFRGIHGRLIDYSGRWHGVEGLANNNSLRNKLLEGSDDAHGQGFPAGHKSYSGFYSGGGSVYAEIPAREKYVFTGRLVDFGKGTGRDSITSIFIEAGVDSTDHRLTARRGWEIRLRRSGVENRLQLFTPGGTQALDLDLGAAPGSPVFYPFRLERDGSTVDVWLLEGRADQHFRGSDVFAATNNKLRLRHDIGGFGSDATRFGWSDLVLSVSAAPRETFAEWLAINFSDEELARDDVGGFEGNFAGDGISNLLKYAFDLNPREAVSGGGLARTEMENGRFVSRAPVNEAARNVTIRAEVSEDLIHWRSGYYYLEMAEEPVAEGRILVARTAGDEVERRFLRWRVVYEEDGSVPPDGGLRPFHLAADIEPGSALDVSFLLERPAGARGAVRTEGDGMKFADGSPARFWGVNMSWDALYPLADDAEPIARRLAMSGVNLVRLTYLDGGEYGIFRRDLNNTTTTDAVRFDRLNRWVAALKEHGVYVLVQLDMGRQVLKPGDLPAGFGAEYFSGARSVGAYAIGRFLVPEIQANERLLWRKILESVNPYTGIRWVDEPAVAAVAVLNEASLYYEYGLLAPENLPVAVYAELIRRWNLWLVNEYGSRDGLVAIWGAGLVGAEEDPARGTVTVDLSLMRTAAWRASPENARADARGNDWNRFLADLGREYYESARDFLVDIGVTQPISLNAGGNFVVADRRSQAELGGFFDEHNYHDHPVFASGIEYRNQSALRSGNTMVKRLAQARLADLPYGVTEWDYCYPNEWRAEGGLIMAAYAGLQDWSLLTRFTYWAGSWANREEMYGPGGRISSAWRFHNDPAVFGQWPATALLFLRGDVRPARRSIDVGFSAADANWVEPTSFPPDRLGFLGPAAFQHRIQSVFFDEVFEGVGDFAVSSGRSGAGDYRAASASVLGSGNPAGDIHNLSPQSFKAPENGFVETASRVREGGDDWLRRVLAEKPEIRGDLFPARKDGFIPSDTGEILYHDGRGILLIDTPRSQGMAGFARYEVLNTKDLRLEVENDFATIMFSSLDGEPLRRSARILVVAVGRAQNSGFSPIRIQESPEMYRVTSAGLGTGPILIDPIRFAATLARDADAPPLEAFALAGNGARTARIPLDGLRAAARLEIDGRAGTIYYELAAPESSEEEQ